MSQKIAFITGGNRGLGFQTALELGAAGIKTIIGSRDLKLGEEAAAKLSAAGIDADVIEFDITRSVHHKAAYDYFAAKYGRLDILVNNAGIAAGTFPPVGPDHSAGEVPLDVLRKVFETNFFSQVALTEVLLPLLKKSEAGRIVNLSSILGSLTLHSRSRSRRSTMPSPLPTTPRRPRSTPSPFIWPGSCATPRSRSTRRTPAG